MQGQSPAQHNESKDLVLLQLRRGSQLWLQSDPRPENSIYHGAAKRKKKEKKRKEKRKKREGHFLRFGGIQVESSQLGSEDAMKLGTKDALMLGTKDARSWNLCLVFQRL